MRRLAATTLTLALVVGAAACGGDDDDTSGAASPTTASSTSTSTSSVPPTSSVACVPVGGGESVMSPLPSAVMLLTDVEVSSANCKDTVTFGFDSDAPEAPGFRVEYQSGPITADGSGAPVAVDGDAYLVVRLEPATGFDFENNRESYTGPERVPMPEGVFANEVVRTGDFEGVTTWVIGVDDQVQFDVNATGAPDHQVTVTLG